ncbi:GNAT family N-acetyltransferase [Cellulosilyticum ruminicola]|uniref:GNAT family N-acetyltransferase n=1 Tax=Cellulosilyticum ruminicola TaxID=425254 RepID=UPI0006CFFFE9|nr:GNAT family N-acetyltransferase [Cellulosilyticum ruminicola]
MNIRHATQNDLAALAVIEAASYPSAEGASKESIKERIEHFSDCFWILEDENKEIVSFINGMLTDKENLIDEMYENPLMHDKNGKWLMIFSVVTDPKYRGKGYASRVMKRVIEDMQMEDRTGIVLTCKEKLIGFYGQFGFKNEGISVSTHGDVVWYQMRLKMQE